MDLVPLDEQCQLFISPSIDEWKPIEDHGITAVIDLDGDLDLGIPNIPNHMLDVDFPIFDEGLPDLNKLHAVARLGARLVANGEKVLAHCGSGFQQVGSGRGISADLSRDERRGCRGSSEGKTARCVIQRELRLLSRCTAAQRCRTGPF